MSAPRQGGKSAPTRYSNFSSSRRTLRTKAVHFASRRHPFHPAIYCATFAMAVLIGHGRGLYAVSRVPAGAFRLGTFRLLEDYAAQRACASPALQVAEDTLQRHSIQNAIRRYDALACHLDAPVWPSSSGPRPLDRLRSCQDFGRARRSDRRRRWCKAGPRTGRGCCRNDIRSGDRPWAGMPRCAKSLPTASRYGPKPRCGKLIGRRMADKRESSLRNVQSGPPMNS